MPSALEMIGITKQFPGVRALSDVSFDVEQSEVHALLGENGAGKSTLMNILAGALEADAGEIRLFGRQVRITNPHEAMDHGVAMIYQEFNLVPSLSAAENVFLGREPRNGVRLVDYREMHRRTDELMRQLGVRVPANEPVERLSVAQQQMVEIAKAVSQEARLIAMDEPSAALSDQEVIHLFNLIRRLQGQGVSVIYISHRLEEVFEVCDRATVLRDGKKIETRSVSQWSRGDIVRAMVGREITDQYPCATREIGEPVLTVRGLRREGRLYDVSLTVRRGEIVGLAGLVGAGRTELARAIFGADPIDGGEMRLNGRVVRPRSPRDAIRLGIGMLTEDRKALGLVLSMAVRENCSMASLPRVVRAGFIRAGVERQEATTLVGQLGIRTPSIEQMVANLSGGNQQKVVLAKWLFTRSKVLIFDEPTRGIDVGAKVEIYNLMNRLASEGVGILMISSDLPEVLGMSDRIVVMHDGRVTGELSAEEATQEKVMRLAIGMEPLLGNE